MIHRITNILRSLTTPILHELPFFLTFFFLMGMRPLLNILDQTTILDPDTTTFDLVGRLAIVFLYGYLLTALIHWADKRWLKVTVYIVTLAFFIFDLFLLRTFDMILRPNVLMLLAETNGSESSEFLRLFVLSKSGLGNLVIIALVIAAICFAERAYRRWLLPRWREHRNAWAGLAIGLVLLFGVFSCGTFVRLLQSSDIERYFGQQEEDMVRPSDPISSLFQSIYGMRLMGKEMRTAISTNYHLDTSATVTESDSLNVVLIIGESHNKYHSSLYGYSLRTNPLLEAEQEQGHLFLFHDAVTPFSITSPAMKNMLCCNSVADDERWQDTPYLPAVFKRAGYNVYFWDNQRKVSPNALYTFAINSFLYNDTIMRLSYTETSNRSFACDYSIMHSFATSNLQMGKHNLVMFHLMGQHFITADRFPHVEQFERFTPDSVPLQAPYLTPRKRQLIADYDNATLYNDYVLKRIIDLFREKNAVVVYLSDHGEETYDYRDTMGRHYTEMDDPWLKYVHEVPFFVWCSDKFVDTHPQMVEQIARSVNRPFTTDNICHMLFHLGGVKTPYYKPDRDIIGDQFKPRRRIVEGKDDFVRVDFDSIRKK